MIAEVFQSTFLTLLFWLPLVFLWFAVLIDILRRHDLSGVAVALWLVAIIVIPFVGALVYFVARPRVSDAPSTEHMTEPRDPGHAAQLH